MTENHLYIHLNSNGEIDYGPGPLPTQWRNVSSLDGLTIDELKSLNWVKPMGIFPDFIPEIQMREGPFVEVFGENGNYNATIHWEIKYIEKESLLAYKYQCIDEHRETNIARGCLVDIGDSNGPFVVQTRGEIDARNITGLAGVATTSLLLGSPFSTDFRDQDDQVHTLNAQQVLMLQAQITVWVQSHYYTAWTHKANLKALYDSDDIQGMVDYDISQGWP